MLSDLFGEQAQALLREMHVLWSLGWIEPFENKRVQVMDGDLVFLHHSQSYGVVSLRVAWNPALGALGDRGSSWQR